MIRLPVWFVPLLVLEACSGAPRHSAPTVPSPVQTPIPPSYTRAITVGQQITLGRALTDTFIGNPLIYALSAPSDGTLIVQLDWDASQGSDDIAHLMLIMGECAVPLDADTQAVPVPERLGLRRAGVYSSHRPDDGVGGPNVSRHRR